MAFFSHTLQSSSQVISTGDVIGMLSYAASNEASNGDARLICGSIISVAESIFTSVSNPASLVFSTSVSADAVEQMRLTSAGYLGINTESPSSHLHVAGNAEIDKLGIGGLAGNNKLVVRERSGQIGGVMVEGNSFPGYMITDITGGNDIVYGVLGNSAGQLLINADFTSQGSNPAVGIAIRSTTHLEVTSGGVKISDEYTLPTSDGSAGQVIKTDGDGNLSFQDDTTGSLNGSGVTHHVARWSNSNTITTGIIQDNDTAVSLSREAGPTNRKLTVTGGTGDNSAAVLIQASGYSTTGSDGFLLSHSNVGDAYVWNFENSNMILGTNNSEAIRIDANSDVGIGTSNPEAKLHVEAGEIATNLSGAEIVADIDTNSNAYTTTLELKGVEAGGSAALHFGGYSFASLKASNDPAGGVSAGKLEFSTRTSASAPTVKMTLDKDGKLGIGTSSPDYKLDVSNNARVGEILIGDIAYTASSAYQGMTHDDWAGITQAYMMISDGNDTLIGSQRNTVIRCNENDGSSQVQVTPVFTQIRQDNNYVAFRTGSTKFNENSNNVDFMVHGDAKLNIIYVDASADKVGIATSTPTESLTVSGGLENLYGWKWFASIGNTVGQGPASGFLLELNEEYGNILSKSYHYTVRLSTNSTGTDTGASYLLWWNNTTTLWEVRPIGQANDQSNHPMIEITNDGTYNRARVYTDNATPYPIRCQVESLFNGDPDCKPHSMGADYHWQRLVDDLYHTEGNVGIGISTPALQSAGKGLHINSDGVNSEIKFTNTTTGAAADQGVALVATNSSFTINNRSAGDLNINTNNTNAISINSSQEVDVKKLLKVRLGNTVGTAGSINRVSYYDDLAGTKAGIGLSTGNINYVTTGAITQSFYTGGIKNLRLDPSGKVVMGAGSNVVAGDASLNYNVGICTNAAVNAALQVIKLAPTTGMTSFFNQYNRLTVPSGTLTAVRGIYQDVVVKDGANLSNIYGYATGTNTVNTGGNVDTVIGYYVNNVFLRGSSSNYGIYSDANKEETGYADKWGFFMAGTAPNYYRGGLKTSILDGRHGSDYICERVAGGYKALGNTSTNAGYLKIRLPEYLPEQKAGSTMMMFDVSIYEYKSGSYKNFHLGGYVYWNTGVQQSQWINTTATMEVDKDIDNSEPWIVRFATDEDDYPCVLICKAFQNETTNWAYGQVYVQNVRTGFGRTAWDQWSQNWEISLEARDTTTGGYYNVASSYCNKPIMHNQIDYAITAGSHDILSPSLNKIIINQNQTVFNENGVNADFRVEGDTTTHLLFVDASADSVGVGAVNPTNKLDVYTDGTGEGITVRGTNAPGIKFWDQTLAGGGSRILEQNSASVSGQLIIDADYNNVGSESSIDFRVGNETKMVVQQNGSVGIGLKPRPDAQLHVGGPITNPTLMIGTGSNIASSICSLKFQDRGPASDQDADGQITGYVQMERDGNSQNFDMTFGTVNTTAGDAVERMRIDRDGLIGIGTNAPDKLLHVDNSGRGAGTSFLVQGDDDSYMSVQNKTSGDFLKLGSVYTNNNYMGLSHSNITNTGYMIMSDGTHTFLSSNTNGRVYIRGGKNDGTKGEIRLGEGLVQINPASLNVDLIVYGDTVSQLFRTDASKDSILIGTSSDGGINSRLYIYDDGAAKINVTNSRTLQVQGRAYTTANGTHYHIGALTRAEKWMSDGSTDAGYVIGLNAVPVVYSDSAGGQNTLTEMTAVRANMSINSSLADGVNITNAFDIKCIPSLAGTNNTVTNHYGIYLTSATNATATVTNAYGVFQEDNDASNRFAGRTSIGTLSPANDSTLFVNGDIYQSDTSARNKLMGRLSIGNDSVASDDKTLFVEGDVQFYGAAEFVSTDNPLGATFKISENTVPSAPKSIQQLSVYKVDRQLYLMHLENEDISAGSTDEINAIRMSSDTISFGKPPVNPGFSWTHYPKFSVNTETGRCTVEGDTFQIATPGTPASSSATGTKGDIQWDADHIYVCTATDTWKRTTISTW